MDNYIILIIISVVALILYIVIDKIISKTKKYLSQNSKPLLVLSRTNEKYQILKPRNYDLKNTYDNNIFYNNISCLDYLIYQLQFKKVEIYKYLIGIRNINDIYKEYKIEIDKIDSFGDFKNCNKLKYKILCFFEKRLFNKKVYNSPQYFYIHVTLHCSKINGVIYDTKKQKFDASQILSIIDRLNDRNGEFYNDRFIWDAICRVERGKVSNKMRFSIYKRDNYRCRICGRTERQDALEIDHIKPIAKGGKSTYDNLQTLCRRCNKEKGDTY